MFISSMSKPSSEIEAIGKAVLNAAYEVHNELGPGLLESVYQECLALVMTEKGHSAVRERPVPIRFRDHVLDVGFRADIIVDDLVLVELKATETMHPIYAAQTITHLKLTSIHLGFLINFNVVHLKDGIRRFVHPSLMGSRPID